MNKTLKNILKGSGSILNVFPNPLPPLQQRLKMPSWYDPKLSTSQQDGVAIKQDFDTVISDIGKINNRVYSDRYSSNQ